MKALILLLCSFSLFAADTKKFDVVVYGGTAGGVMAAVSAAREGLKTALLEPGGHIGGMVSGGLGYTDYGKKEVIGGLALEFYIRVGKHYQIGRHGYKVGWLHEPSVAEKIFREMLAEAGVAIEQTRLKEHGGVFKNGGRLTSVTDERGNVYQADIFIDSSYEGDLMAQSGVTWTYGRESQAKYGESLAGVRERTPLHQFLVNVSPKGPDGKLLPEVSNAKLPAPGSADKAVQAYNYRMCFSDQPDNRVPFAKPANYSAARYELLARLIEARQKAEGKVPGLNTLLKIDPLPNGKADVNNQGAFSTDYIGASWSYPNAGYTEREKIWQAHKEYIQGLFFFLSNDSKVPETLRVQMNKWGLCRDEFTDTGHWPNQLYIRESRRMVGEFVISQKDLQTDLTKSNPIGMGSYNSDSHNVQRIVDVDGFVRNEGDMQVAVKPYQIPYGVITPRQSEVQNLLVPVAFSATHVAYSSVRMEPQYMILGQAAGVAAKMAINAGKPVQQIDNAVLSKRLIELGAVIEYVPSSEARNISKLPKAVQK